MKDLRVAQSGLLSCQITPALLVSSVIGVGSCLPTSASLLLPPLCCHHATICGHLAVPTFASSQDRGSRFADLACNSFAGRLHSEGHKQMTKCYLLWLNWFSTW